MGYRGYTGEITPNWEDVDAGAPTPLERGIYSGVIVAVTFQDTKKGDPSMKVQLEVTEKYKSSEEVKRKVYDTLTINETSLFKIKQVANAAEIDLPKTTSFGNMEKFADAMVDSEVWVLLDVRHFEGKQFNNVRFYVPDEDLEETYKRVFEDQDSDPSGGGAREGRRGGGKSRADRAAERSQGEKSEEKDETRSSKSNGKAKADSEEIQDNDEESEEKPRRVRRRRRQAEQG